MLSPELVQLAAMALAGLAVGGVVYVLVMPFMSERAQGEQAPRQRGARPEQAQMRAAVPQPLQMRKQQVQDTIKNIEAKQKASQAGAASHRA